MGATTKIAWSQATWNPATGCTKVSPGCDHCYAETFAERWRGTEGHYFENGFDVQLRPNMMEMPLRWTKPRRIFVNSMSDMFHDAIPDDYIVEVFSVMAAATHHTFQILTKRPGRMKSLLNSDKFRADIEHDVLDRHGVLDIAGWPLPNVWLGVSAEDQKWAQVRIPLLCQTPAAVRFVSAEPLLGPINLFDSPDGGETVGPAIERNPVHWFSPDYGDVYDWDDQVGIDWVIVGGESGAGARGMDPAWARDLRDQCRDAEVAFFFKQAGTVLAREWGINGKGENPDDWPERFPQDYPAGAVA